MDWESNSRVFHISNSIRTRKIICAPPTNLFPGVIKTVEPLRNDEAEALFLSRAQSPLNHFLNLWFFGGPMSDRDIHSNLEQLELIITSYECLYWVRVACRTILTQSNQLCTCGIMLIEPLNTITTEPCRLVQTEPSFLILKCHL